MSLINAFGGAGYTGRGAPSAVSGVQTTDEGFELQKPFIEDLFTTVQAETFDIADDGTKTLRPYEEFTGPRIAEFAPETEDALTGLASLGREGLAASPLAASPQYFQAAKDAATLGQAAFTTADAQRLMNPFLDEVIEQQKREAQRRFESVERPKLDAEAVAQGSFGGSRAALLQAEANRNLQRRLDDIESKGRLTAFEQAQKAFQDERNRQLQGAQMFTALGTEAPTQAARELGLLSSAGEVRQAQEQRALDLAEAEFIRQRDFPMKQLQEMQSVVRGYPFSPSTYEVTTRSAPPQPTFGQQLLGGLGTAAGLFGAFGGFQPGRQAGGQVVPRQSGGQVRGGLAGLERHQNNAQQTGQPSLARQISQQVQGPRMPIPQVRVTPRPQVNLSDLTVQGLVPKMVSPQLTAQSPAVTDRNALLKLISENAETAAAKRLELATPTESDIKYRALLEEKGEGFDELKETITEESEKDIEGITQNKWLALADLSLDFMGRGGEEGDNWATKVSDSAKKTGFTDKIMNAAKQERDAAKEMRKKLSEIDDKEIANQALLAGISKEDVKARLTAEINNLSDTERVAKEGISQQAEIRKQEADIRGENREVAKILRDVEEATAALEVAKAKRAGKNDLKPAEYNAFAKQVAFNTTGVNWDSQREEFTVGTGANAKTITPGSSVFGRVQIQMNDLIKAGERKGSMPKSQEELVVQSVRAYMPELGKVDKQSLKVFTKNLNTANGEKVIKAFVEKLKSRFPEIDKEKAIEKLRKLRSGYIGTD